MSCMSDAGSGLPFTIHLSCLGITTGIGHAVLHGSEVLLRPIDVAQRRRLMHAVPHGPVVSPVYGQ